MTAATPPFNCEYVPYRGYAVQWDGSNTADILAMLDDAHLHDADHILIRYPEGCATLQRGWLVVRGQNGAVRVYDPEHFKIKYRMITP